MSDLIPIEVDDQLWERVFVPSPLVLIGTQEENGSHDFAPKHRVIQLPRHFGFVCRPTHATWQNVLREEAFTVSWPGPNQIVMTSAAASPRCEDGEKKPMRALPTIEAESVKGFLLKGSRFYLECKLDRVVDDLGDDGVLIGRIVAARAERGALRNPDVPDDRLVHDHPLMVYLHPRQFALIEHSSGFPYPKGFHRE